MGRGPSEPSFGMPERQADGRLDSEAAVATCAIIWPILSDRAAALTKRVAAGPSALARVVAIVLAGAI